MKYKFIKVRKLKSDWGTVKYNGSTFDVNTEKVWRMGFLVINEKGIFINTKYFDAL